MTKLSAALLLASVLAGCSGMPARPIDMGPCSTNPGGYECQIERYQKAT